MDVNDTETWPIRDTDLTQECSYPVPSVTRVYFIGNGEAIKIGVSVNPKQRRSDLQVGCPERLDILATVRGDYETERKYHDQFAALAIDGEWFRAEEPLLQEIARINGHSAAVAEIEKQITAIRGKIRRARFNSEKDRLSLLIQLLIRHANDPDDLDAKTSLERQMRLVVAA